MALFVIVSIYVTLGLMSSAGSVSISRKVFSAKGEQIFFALFLIAIAAFYLAFTAYFDQREAWRCETGAVIVFAGMGLLGIRIPVFLIAGYFLHGFWDLLHELHAHGGSNLTGAPRVTEIPLGYGFFCAVYDWCMTAYFYTRWDEWRSAWGRKR